MALILQTIAAFVAQSSWSNQFWKQHKACKWHSRPSIRAIELIKSIRAAAPSFFQFTSLIAEGKVWVLDCMNWLDCLMWEMESAMAVFLKTTQSVFALYHVNVFRKIKKIMSREEKNTIRSRQILMSCNDALPIWVLGIHSKVLWISDIGNFCNQIYLFQ